MIGKTLTVHGHLTGREDLMVDGRVEGDIELMENRLTIGAGGQVQGGVKAREIVVFGTVNGNLEATERIEIKKNAKVMGDLRSARFVIEDEAYFKGNIDTIRAETPKTAAAAPNAPQAVKATVAAAPMAASAAAAGSGLSESSTPAQPSLIQGVRDSKR